MDRPADAGVAASGVSDRRESGGVEGPGRDVDDDRRGPSGATLDPPLDTAQFTWQKNNDHYVRYLVAPPDPQDAPSKLLGKPIPDFPFSTAAGKQQNSASLAGHATVLDFWAKACVPCLESMPHVAKVREKYAGNDKVRFLAVNVDPSNIKDAEVEQALRDIGVTIPWARIDEAGVEKIMPQLSGGSIPAMAVLDAHGIVQYVRVGRIRTCRKTCRRRSTPCCGPDLAKETTQTWEYLQQQYRQNLAAASIECADEKGRDAASAHRAGFAAPHVSA